MVVIHWEAHYYRTPGYLGEAVSGPHMGESLDAGVSLGGKLSGISARDMTVSHWGYQPTVSMQSEIHLHAESGYLYKTLESHQILSF